jgi:phosphoribosylformylglycinamidine synthase
MKTLQVSIVRFPGTNCEYDTQYAFRKLGHETDIVWHEEESIPEKSDLVVIPGGFSYGDYLRSGSIARFSPVMKAVAEYAEKGGTVLGICNGFQVLTEAGLLPGALKRNNSLHFISRYQYIKVENNDNDFLKFCEVGDILNIPIAHADGNYFADEETLEDMRKNGQILLRYCNEDGEPMVVNGSVGQIAGICNAKKNVFGLMPHPERAIEDILGSEDGLRMLEGFGN